VPVPLPLPEIGDCGDVWYGCGMGLKRLDHINVCTTQLSKLKAFYSEVLGLTPGPRPNFSFGGAWMYCGAVPSVHLVEREALTPTTGDLRLQHFAFSAEDLEEFLARLKRLEVQYRVGIVEDFELCQINVVDPDGNHVHIDFPLSEARRLGVERTPR
jgi:catechol 2,3-dioxygenase-like lactoylglutathione lyase family enzyme